MYIYPDNTMIKQNHAPMGLVPHPGPTWGVLPYVTKRSTMNSSLQLIDSGGSKRGRTQRKLLVTFLPSLETHKKLEDAKRAMFQSQKNETILGPVVQDMLPFIGTPSASKWIYELAYARMSSSKYFTWEWTTVKPHQRVHDKVQRNYCRDIFFWAMMFL